MNRPQQMTSTDKNVLIGIFVFVAVSFSILAGYAAYMKPKFEQSSSSQSSKESSTESDTSPISISRSSSSSSKSTVETKFGESAAVENFSYKVTSAIVSNEVPSRTSSFRSSSSSNIKPSTSSKKFITLVMEIVNTGTEPDSVNRNDLTFKTSSGKSYIGSNVQDANTSISKEDLPTGYLDLGNTYRKMNPDEKGLLKYVLEVPSDVDTDNTLAQFENYGDDYKVTTYQFKLK